MSTQGPESLSGGEITGKELRQALDDLFRVRSRIWEAGGGDRQVVDTRTYADWDAKDHFTAPIWQQLDLLERPFDPETDTDLDEVPQFTVERWIYFPEPDQHRLDHYLIVDGIRHELWFEDDGIVTDSYEEFRPEVARPSNHGLFQHFDTLTPEQMGEWHRKLTSPELTPRVKAQHEIEEAKRPKPIKLDEEAAKKMAAIALGNMTVAEAGEGFSLAPDGTLQITIDEETFEAISRITKGEPAESNQPSFFA